MKKAIKLLMLLLMMGLIFYFSSQPSDDSTITTSFVLDIAYKIYHFIFQSISIDYEQFANAYFMPIRKLAHFTEFGILGLLAYINIKEYTKKNIVLYSVLFSSIYAASDEIHQLFVPGRACAFTDILIDSCGALFTILLIHLISKKCLKK